MLIEQSFYYSTVIKVHQSQPYYPTELSNLLWLDSITKGSHPVFTRISLYYFLSVPDQLLSFPPLKCIHFQGPVKYRFLYEAVTDFQQKISWQWLPLGCHSLLFIPLHSSRYPALFCALYIIVFKPSADYWQKGIVLFVLVSAQCF